MFSMTSLQSQQSPLRKNDYYYQPKNRPTSKSRRKIFNKHFQNSYLHQMYNPQQKQISTRQYLDELSKTKTLPRKGHKRQEIYSFITFRRSNHKDQSPNEISFNKDKSLSSIKLSTIQVSRTSSLCSILDRKRKESFTNKWRDFEQKLSARDEESKNDLRFTFYNNEKKAKLIMEKYKKDEHLDDRGTNLYQNIFNRTIARETLFATLGQIEKRRKKGQVI